LKSFNQFIIENISNVKDIQKDLKALLKSYKTYSHDKNSTGFLVQKSGVSIKDISKIAAKHKLRIVVNGRESLDLKWYQWTGTSGPYSDVHLSVDSEDGIIARNIILKTVVDKT